MGRHRLGFGSNSGSMQGAIVLDRLAQWCFSLLGSRYFAELQILRYGLIKTGGCCGLAGTQHGALEVPIQTRFES